MLRTHHYDGFMHHLRQMSLGWCDIQWIDSLSIRRCFWGERGKMEAKKGESCLSPTPLGRPDTQVSGSRKNRSVFLQIACCESLRDKWTKGCVNRQSLHEECYIETFQCKLRSIRLSSFFKFQKRSSIVAIKTCCYL